MNEFIEPSSHFQQRSIHCSQQNVTNGNNLTLLLLLLLISIDLGFWTFSHHLKQLWIIATRAAVDEDEAVDGDEEHQDDEEKGGKLEYGKYTQQILIFHFMLPLFYTPSRSLASWREGNGSNFAD